MYGTATLTVPTAELPESDLDTTPVTYEDIPALGDLWHAHDGTVGFAIDPGTSLMDWISPNPAIRSLAFRDGDAIIGVCARIWPLPAAISPSA